MHTFDPNKVQRAVIAKIFGVHPTTVSRWRKAGCPCNPDSTYSALSVHKWLLDQERESFVPKSDMASCDSPALERYREARAAIAELDLKTREGELIAREDVAREWALRVAEVAAGLEFLADRLPPLLVGREREEIRTIIGKEIWRLRDTYSRNGRYCKSE
jgi:phage terminase Nu1 subunit (DNA packaging protein)